MDGRARVSIAIVIVIVLNAVSAHGDTDRANLTKPDGKPVTLGEVLADLMHADFVCEAQAVESWVGWRCLLETVAVSIEGGADGVRTLALQSPDLSEAGGDRVGEAIAMLFGNVLVFGLVSDDPDAPVDVMAGANDAAGGVFVLPLRDRVFAAMQNREQDNLTVIFKQVDTTTEQVAATAASVMESVPTIP